MTLISQTTPDFQQVLPQILDIHIVLRMAIAMVAVIHDRYWPVVIISNLQKSRFSMLTRHRIVIPEVPA